MKYNNYKHKHYKNFDNGEHPKHPVRNVFYCIFCIFFSLSFSFLWVNELFDFDDVWGYVVLAILIIIGAIIGFIMSLRKYLQTQKVRAIYLKSMHKSWNKKHYR